jgi:methylmalonyl-CoA mutase
MIRTTLQALYAIYDNSLHTNAYDEAITTTEESVRRAMAIQLIINKELGLQKMKIQFKVLLSSKN